MAYEFRVHWIQLITTMALSSAYTSAQATDVTNLLLLKMLSNISFDVEYGRTPTNLNPQP